MKWISVISQPPKDFTIVETKIDDGILVRNQQLLKKCGNLWFLPDGNMYVYYTPTHWRPIKENKEE